MKVLIIEDDEEIGRLIEQPLKANGMETKVAASGEDGLKAVTQFNPAFLILDILLPGMSGFDVCVKLRSDERTGLLPIIILSSDDAEEDIVKGLNLGADDYITKPFSASVLLARIQSVLRRTARSAHEMPSEDGRVVCEGLSLDMERFLAMADSETLELGVSEFRILQTLMTHRGKVLTRDQIIRAVHGDNYPVTGRSVDVQIVSLRKKVGRYASYIETVRGIGYRFIE